MTERPILFSGEMVRAILAGTKTQTRRPVKPQPDVYQGYEATGDGDPGWCLEWPKMPEDGLFPGPAGPAFALANYCPFGAPGDRLWVRETFKDHSEIAPEERPVLYRADDPQPQDITWQPSIHMPRWASRLTLEVTGVRVERLQEISEEDARAEGCGIDTEFCKSPPRVDFASTWERLYGLQSWIDNPWVWVVEFRRARP